MFSSDNNSLFRATDKAFPQTSALTRLRDCTQRMEKNFSPLNMYLWIHGIGYTESFQCSCTIFAMWIVSLALSVLFEGNVIFLMYAGFGKIHAETNTSGKRQLFLILISICLLIQRTQCCIKRGQIKELFRQLSKLNVIVSGTDRLDFRFKLLAILLLNDAVALAALFIYFSSFSSPLFGYMGDSYYLGGIPPPNSTFLFYVTLALLKWCDPSTATAALFSVKCYIVKKTLVEFKKRLAHKDGFSVDDSFQIYSEITNLIRDISGTYHTILVAFFAASLWCIFFESYMIAFSRTDTSRDTAYRLVMIVLDSSRFVAICLSASSVTTAAREVKKIIYYLPFDADWNNLRFILKVKDEFVGFKLIDSIVIEKKFILTAIANLLTYGIMIATFNTNSEDGQS